MNLKNLYYMNDDEEIEFNEMCQKCPYNCKQSFRSTIMTCKYLKDLKKKGNKK